MKLWEKAKEQLPDTDRELIIQSLCPDEYFANGKKYTRKDCEYTTYEGICSLGFERT